MNRTFATYEHSCLGFPGVVLKWTEENRLWEKTPRIVIKGVISNIPWAWRNQYPEPYADYEMQLFDNWVRKLYGNDVTVQG